MTSCRLVDQRGFTMIEVIVAIMMMVLLIAAASSLFVTGTDSSLAQQRNAAAIAVADQQIETIRQEVKTQGFDALAMNAVPAAGSGKTLSYDSATYLDPNSFATPQAGCGPSGEGLAIEANYDNSVEGPASGLDAWSGCTASASIVAEPLEVLAGGFVVPQQTGVAGGTDTVTVDTFVTDTFVGCNSANQGGGTCPTVSNGVVSGCTFPASTATSTTCADARRVVVAVIPNNHGRNTIGRSSPVYVTTVFTNPTPSNSPDSQAGVGLGVRIG